MLNSLLLIYNLICNSKFVTLNLVRQISDLINNLICDFKSVTLNL